MAAAGIEWYPMGHFRGVAREELNGGALHIACSAITI
jgi:hypothetical protein